MLLIDSSVLLRAFNTAHPDYAIARSFLVTYRRTGEKLVAFPQIVAEFWVVSTRPVERNGLAQSVEETAKRVAFLEQLGEVLLEHHDAYDIWKQLVVDCRVAGKPTHDARIVAQMLAHRLDTIVTFNTKDFSRYVGVTVLTPAEALARQ